MESFNDLMEVTTETLEDGCEHTTLSLTYAVTFPTQDADAKNISMMNVARQQIVNAFKRDAELYLGMTEE